MNKPIDLAIRISQSRVGLAALVAAVGSGMSAPADDRAAAPRTDRSSRFTFSLLPKSFQRRPSLDFHVITELTAQGKKLTPPSAENPVYYIAQPGQFTRMGNNVPASETPPDLAQLTRAMEAALACSHHVKASPSTPPPAIAVVFNYGSFARFSLVAYDQQDDEMLAQLADQMDVQQRMDAAVGIRSTGVDSSMVYRGPMLRSENRATDALLSVVLSHKMERDEVLRRATLVGGEKFARDLAKAFSDEAYSRTAMLGFAGVEGASPFHLFMNANENLMMLVEDSFNGCYFAIASAFDYRAMRQGRRVLLWRTKMTVNSSGISMSESLPALVLAAGPYLGKEMPDAVTLTRRIHRDGKVEIGPTRVIETDIPLRNPAEPIASPAPSPAKAPGGMAAKP